MARRWRPLALAPQALALLRAPVTTWTPPPYAGWPARGCWGVVGDTGPACPPVVGRMGTLPKSYENGLVSDGDPALAFGPKPDASGDFSWANGSRLYYANLTA